MPSKSLSYGQDSFVWRATQRPEGTAGEIGASEAALSWDTMRSWDRSRGGPQGAEEMESEKPSYLWKKLWIW